MNSIHHGFEKNETGRIFINVETSDSNLRIVYSDNGKGIPEENLKRIFEPFFTTDRTGGGTGLGLNIVYNLITQTLKGSIECVSNPGEMTKFILEFPRDTG